MTVLGQIARDVEVSGIRLRVLSEGQGPPLLFLHGSGDLGSWPEILTDLSRHFTIIRPDHPGFTGSEDGEHIKSVHDISFVYLSLMDQLGLDKVSVMGVSLGGWIAADMAATEPSRFDRIVLVDAAGLRPRGEYPDYFMLTPVELAERVYATDNMRESMVAFMTDLESDSEVFGTYHRNRASTAHLAFNPYMHDTQLPTRLHRVKADTLVVWGAKDGILPLETSDAWLQAIPAAKRIVIDEAGHLPHIEQRERFLAAVSPFLGI